MQRLSILVLATTATFAATVQTAATAAAQTTPAAQTDQESTGARSGTDIAAVSWPSFRGAHARGVAEGFATPTTWNVAKGENIAWRTGLPGLAHSSPILFGDRIFVTTAVKDGEAPLKVGLYGSIGSVEDDSEHEFRVLCLDRISGKILWSQTAWRGVPKVKRHPKGSHAASTPATDGEHVVAFFGSEGLHAYDFEGKRLWKNDLGELDSGFFMMKSAQWGFGSSPVIHRGRVYVQCDVQKNSFVAAFDVETGKEIWRTKRDEICGWGTPTVDTSTKRHQLILNGYKHIGGYALDNGEALWKTAGGGDIPVPTPIVANGLVYITSAHGRMAPIIAVSAAATGEFAILDTAGGNVAWAKRRGGNYLQTPIVYRGLFYGCRDSGILLCCDAKTGERHFKKRLTTAGGGFTASPVAADGKLYYTSEEGEVYVLRAGKEFEILATNELGEICMASPAVSRGTLYFRTRSHLVAIAERPATPRAKRSWK